MSVSIGLKRASGLFLAVFLAGCAARSSHGIAAPPAARAAHEASGADGGDLSAFMAKVRHLSTALRPDKPDARRRPQLLEDRDPELAAELKLLASAPSAAIHRSIAERYRERGVLDAAYSHFTSALALDPHDAESYEGLARVWRDWGLPQLGLADAYRATFYAPRSAPAYNTYGTLMQALGRNADARRAYEEASRLDPDAAYPLNNLCYLSFLEGRIDAAVDGCRKALRLDPSLAAARNNLALAFAASGRLDLARAQFLDAGDRATGLYNAGIMYMAAGDPRRAVAAFDEASRTRVSFALARERARQARALLATERPAEDAGGGSQ